MVYNVAGIIHFANHFQHSERSIQREYFQYQHMESQVHHENFQIQPGIYIFHVCSHSSSSHHFETQHIRG